MSEAPIGSWDFWKRRLARLLVGLGLALLLLQWLPALPEDQRVVFDAPEGYRIERLDLRYTEPGHSEVLIGAQLRPAEPATRTTHPLRLPRGEYLLAGSAQLVAGERSLAVPLHQALELKGGTAHVPLEIKSRKP